jgi:hypothetical protein
MRKPQSYLDLKACEETFSRVTFSQARKAKGTYGVSPRRADSLTGRIPYSDRAYESTEENTGVRELRSPEYTRQT